MPDNDYILRCIELARLGAGFVSPNPMVGAVLVYKNRIIGEGYHKKFGEPHAEVNCIASVKEEDKKFIGDAVLYVSLEPCAHHGKTPPCTDLILKNRIQKVVIGCRDPFEAVNGKGIEKLKATGIEVALATGHLLEACIKLNSRFFCFHIKKRPYVILKWAETVNGLIAGERGDPRLMISNPFSNRLVHKWRSEEDAILVGTNTAKKDDPVLTNRYWPGPSTLRLVVDTDLKLEPGLKIFNHEATTIIFNYHQHDMDPGMNIMALRASKNNFHFKIDKDLPMVSQLLHAMYKLNINSVMIEGGANLQQQFINEEAWDEARVISGTTVFQKTGIASAVLKNEVASKNFTLQNDQVRIYTNSLEGI